MAGDRTIEDVPAPRRLGPFQVLTEISSEPGVQLWNGVLRTQGGLERPVLVARALVGGPSASALERESRLALEHPNVMEVVDLHRMDDFVAAGYARPRGRPLSSVLDRIRESFSRVPPHCAMFVATQVLDALAYAQEANRDEGPLTHGCLIPEMVWIGFDGRVQVRGFGYGPSQDAPRRGLAFALPAGFASREHVHGMPLDPRTDVYAVGVLLFTMLTGRPPSSEDVPSLDRVLPNASPRLTHAVRRATDPDRRQRSSADHLRDELNRILLGEDPTFGRGTFSRWVGGLFGADAAVEYERERTLATTPDLAAFGPTGQRPPLERTPSPAPAPDTPQGPRDPIQPAPPPKLPPAPDFNEASPMLPPEPAPPPPPAPPTADLAAPSPSPVGGRAPVEPHAQGSPPPPPVPREDEDGKRGGLPPALIAAAGAVLLLVIWASFSSTFQTRLRHAFVGRQPGAALVLESVPDGALVTLDGAATGRKTPLTVNNVESGVEHRVRMELEGQPARTATVTLEAGASKTLRLTFPGAAVTAKLASTPKDAEIWLDGRKVELTPAELTLRVGTEVEIEIKKLGYERWSRTFTPEPNTPINLDVPLAKSAELEAQEALEADARRAAGQ